MQSPTAPDRFPQKRPNHRENCYQSVIEHLHVGVVVHSPSLEVLLWNPKALELLDITEEQLKKSPANSTTWNVYREDGSSCPIEEYPACTSARTHEPVHNVVLGIFRPHHGDLVWLLVDTEPFFDAHGNLVEIVCTFSDITAFKKLQEKLQRTQQLDIMGQLAGSIAHDFNNLLLIISASAEFIELDLPKDSPLQEEASLIQDTAKRGAQLTQRLLSLAGKSLNVVQTVHLDDAVLSAKPFLLGLLNPSVRLHFDLQANDGHLRIDPVQLEQILLNLVLNARDAISQKGEIFVQTTQENESLNIIIRDTGQGIPPNKQEQVFEPFYTTKEIGKGTGLGLYSVRSAVQEAKGRIKLTSQLGKGTTISMSFPLAPPPKTPKSTAPLTNKPTP